MVGAPAAGVSISFERVRATVRALGWCISADCSHKSSGAVLFSAVSAQRAAVAGKEGNHVRVINYQPSRHPVPEGYAGLGKKVTAKK